MARKIFDWLEIFLIFIGSIILLYSIFLYKEPNELTFIPNAVTGLGTISGVMSTFVGYWLTHAFTHLVSLPKKWIMKRVRIIAFIVGFSIMSVAASLIELAMGNLITAFRGSLVGIISIQMSIFEILFILGFADTIS